MENGLQSVCRCVGSGEANEPLQVMGRVQSKFVWGQLEGDVYSHTTPPL